MREPNEIDTLIEAHSLYVNYIEKVHPTVDALSIGAFEVHWNEMSDNRRQELFRCWKNYNSGTDFDTRGTLGRESPKSDPQEDKTLPPPKEAPTNLKITDQQLALVMHIGYIKATLDCFNTTNGPVLDHCGKMLAEIKAYVLKGSQ